MKNRSEYIIGSVELGTDKTSAAVLKVGGDQFSELIGFHSMESCGIKHGVVIHLEEATQRLREVFDEAERSAGVEVDSVYAGISGTHVRGINARGVVSVAGKDHVIDKSDIKRAIDSGRTIPIPIQDKIIHVITQGFTIDEEEGFLEPLGLWGNQLEVDLHIITAYEGAVRNLVKTIHDAGLGVKGIIFNPLAAAEMILTSAEKELGVVLIDMGAGTTDILAYSEGRVWQSASIAMGGNQITADIAKGIRVMYSDAEILKCNHGIIMGEKKDHRRKRVSIPRLPLNGELNLPLDILSDIICARLEEIIEQVRDALIKSGVYNYLAAGVVLTGGSALLPRISNFVEDYLGLPVRIGGPDHESRLPEEFQDPAYSVIAGLHLYGITNHPETTSHRHIQKSSLLGIAGGALGWLANTF